MIPDTIPWLLGVLVVSAPLALVAALGGASLFGVSLPEKLTSGLVQFATIVGFSASLGMLAYMLVANERHVALELGHWVSVPEFHFHIKFIFDRLSIPFVVLSLLLCGTVGTFASRYLHREPGFQRFFVLYSLFLLGMVIAALADTIETLFAGWELVGISSALLVAFFQERINPVRNGLRVWVVYRVSDAALLLAAVVLHRLHGEGDFDVIWSASPWPVMGQVQITPYQGLVVGLLLLIAAAGKSALVPFSGWLPRAMEGPTPSSAIFYGALSVHLGAYLLLRISPLLDHSAWLSGAVIALGGITALFAALATRVQSDIKSALSFASLTQVGIIVVEIGIAGFLPTYAATVLRYFALAHIVGHASLRTLQFLRASSLLQDYRMLENAIGQRLPMPAHRLGEMSPGLHLWFYRMALERGYFDALLTDYISQPLLELFRKCDRWERSWTGFLSGRRTADSDTLSPPGGLEEFE